METAIHFGAGNIGRGFIGGLLEQAHYQVIFADINEQIVNEIKEKHQYTIHIMDSTCEDICIKNVTAVNSTSPELIDMISHASIITTAVGIKYLPIIAGTIATGIQHRIHHHITSPLNIIACENGINATSQLKDAVYKFLSINEQTYCTQYAGFPNCSVDRIVPPLKSENPIDVAVERFYEWNVDKDAFVGTLPKIDGMNFASNLSAYIKRKLFTLNTGHAITAYCGNLKGYRTIDESIKDTVIYRIVKSAMHESGQTLIKMFDFDSESHSNYINQILQRFQNPYLNDDIKRVGRDPLRKLSASDRLISPLLAARHYSIRAPYLLLGIGAALHFNNALDEQCREMMELIKEKGLRRALTQITGISKDDTLIYDLERAYYNIEKLFKI